MNIKDGGPVHPLTDSVDGKLLVLCAICGHVNNGTKRRRRWYMIKNVEGRVCGTCVHKVSPGAKAT